MDISGISTSVSSNRFSSATTAGAEIHRSGKLEGSSELQHDFENSHRDVDRGEFALGVFKQELQIALKTQFHAKLAVKLPGYTSQSQPVTANEVAEDALGVAKQLVADEPVNAASTLISFRAKVEETAGYVRKTVGGHDDFSEVDDAVVKVDQGLSKLEDEVATSRESSTSVLAMETKSKQRSSIHIRTQEGDTVKLSLKRVDEIHAAEVAQSGHEGSLNTAEMAVSSKSRMHLKVEGDLNESELTAIRNVLAQAENIANEFFGGDIGAAFNIAQGFDFDSGQLARVHLGFRMHQESNFSYAETAHRAVSSAIEPQIEQTSSDPVAQTTSTPVTATSPSPGPMQSERASVATEQATVDEVSGQVQSVDAEPNFTSALGQFFEQLNAFMRTLGAGFVSESASASHRYHYSESFKFDLLKIVTHTVAPSGYETALENALQVIDQVSQDSATKQV